MWDFVNLIGKLFQHFKLRKKKKRVFTPEGWSTNQEFPRVLVQLQKVCTSQISTEKWLYTVEFHVEPFTQCYDLEQNKRAFISRKSPSWEGNMSFNEVLQPWGEGETMIICEFVRSNKKPREKIEQGFLHENEMNYDTVTWFIQTTQFCFWNTKTRHLTFSLSTLFKFVTSEYGSDWKLWDLRPVHTTTGTQIVEHTVANGSVHTARKQHQKMRSPVWTGPQSRQ